MKNPVPAPLLAEMQAHDRDLSESGSILASRRICSTSLLYRPFEIMRVAILTASIANWNFTSKAAERERNFDNLCDAEIEVNKTGFTAVEHSRLSNAQSAVASSEITRRLYHELTTSLGLPELTPVVCQVDNAAFNSYFPDTIVFNRGGPGQRIADGNKECTFVWNVRDQ